MGHSFVPLCLSSRPVKRGASFPSRMSLRTALFSQAQEG